MFSWAVVGCSPKPPTEHHILPVGFSGVYKIEKVQNHAGGYQIDGHRYIFTIPKSGVLRVAPDVFVTYCRPCNGLTATFADGPQEISLYSPLTRPPDSALDAHMLLGLLGSNEAVWYAVGTHEQLSVFLKQVRLQKYQNLERYLPPNMPFKAKYEVDKGEDGNS